MDREIKFRAWDKKYNVMLCTDFSIIGEVTLFGGVETTLHEQSVLHNDKTPSLERLNDVAIMQFTGLKDKNGVEIYEGDIVKLVSINRISIVKYIGASFRLQIKRNGEFENWDLTAGKTDNIEVIGNIYANPDLIK